MIKMLNSFSRLIQMYQAFIEKLIKQIGLPYLDVYGDINLVVHVIKSHKAQRNKSLIIRVFFVCAGFFVLLETFSLIWRRHHYGWRSSNFDLCSALMAIDQWGFFSVPHLLWHGASVFNGRLRGPVTLAPNAEHLAMELSLPILMT